MCSVVGASMLGVGRRRHEHSPWECTWSDAKRLSRSVLGIGLLQAVDCAAARLLKPGALVLPARVHVSAHSTLHVMQPPGLSTPVRCT